MTEFDAIKNKLKGVKIPDTTRATPIIQESFDNDDFLNPREALGLIRGGSPLLNGNFQTTEYNAAAELSKMGISREQVENQSAPTPLNESYNPYSPAPQIPIYSDGGAFAEQRISAFKKSIENEDPYQYLGDTPLRESLMKKPPRNPNIKPERSAIDDFAQKLKVNNPIAKKIINESANQGGSNIDYAFIKQIVEGVIRESLKDVVKEVVKEVITTDKIDENFQITIGDQIFTGKLTKSKSINK
jgi:hypothetical protein